MNSRIRRRRHLGFILRAAAPQAKSLAKGTTACAETRNGVEIPAEFTPRQYAIFLLHIAAELEHVLMVEYLFAGYSLGGPQVPEAHHAQVARWRETILGIAKEEMGHLMTVQNLLRCLGGPLNLDREDYPWDSQFYPFKFSLEPLTRKSLARYVLAESPGDWCGMEAQEVEQAAETTMPVHHVGTLYRSIEDLLSDEDAVRDSDFRSATYPYQANWDEWGRGYKDGARGNNTGGMAGTPNVLLLPVTSRTDSLEALRAIATQGEAKSAMDDQEEPSHFARFFKIFQAFPKGTDWSPSRKIAPNPMVSTDEEEADGSEGSLITAPESKLWAHLFNVRYRLLLTCLLHTFDYPGSLSETSQTTPRGLLVHATFGEMYNIRAISEILMQSPLDKKGPWMAGPPFQMPYTTRAPLDEVDRWRRHLDLLGSSCLLVKQLTGCGNAGHAAYLQTLGTVDDRTKAMIETILQGPSISLSARRRYH
jgi:Ferritin-like